VTSSSRYGRPYVRWYACRALASVSSPLARGPTSRREHVPAMLAALTRPAWRAPHDDAEQVCTLPPSHSNGGRLVRPVRAVNGVFVGVRLEFRPFSVFFQFRLPLPVRLFSFRSPERPSSTESRVSTSAFADVRMSRSSSRRDAV